MLFCEYSLCLYGRHLQQIQHLQSLRAAEYWEVCISYTQCDMQKVFTNFHSLGYCGTLLQNTGDSKVLAVNVTVDFYLLLKSEYQILHYITNFTKVIPFECVCVCVCALQLTYLEVFTTKHTSLEWSFATILLIVHLYFGSDVFKGFFQHFFIFTFPHFKGCVCILVKTKQKYINFSPPSCICFLWTPSVENP